ncbi:hypothetical protein ACFX1Q_024493 [Malus domestica]|uniref:RRM domain-containing protein n=1 Tax=Malus domestica TaxID=3750 RepID=A0A498HD01_MALDO|nr:hypothetical protein DVH24_037120 [Malus domestica]
MPCSRGDEAFSSTCEALLTMQDEDTATGSACACNLGRWKMPIILAQMENKMQSRGSGFVRFKEEKSVSAAVQAQYVTMAGTPVEIKSLIPKMAAESEKMSLRQQEQEKNCNCQSPPLPVAAKVSSSEMVMEANKPEQVLGLISSPRPTEHINSST